MTDHAPASIPPLHIHLLGGFHIASGETSVTSIEMPRLQSLLAYLVLHRVSPQSRSHLAYQLWPDSTDAQALTNLRASVHRLRQALPHADSLLHTDRQVLAWQPSIPWTLDVLDFEQALLQADQAIQHKDRSAVRQALTNAVDLYQGDLLPSCYDEWILPERERLRQAFLTALEQLIGLLEEERNYPAAIHAAQHLLRYDPLHEATYRQLMRLYAVSGDRAAALRTYHTCVSVLERELGVKPGKATREAYTRLMQTEREEQHEAMLSTTQMALAPLMGRTHEWNELQNAWRSAVAGRTHMLVLSGETGIGKTRLAEELLNWVSRQGNTTATARCYPSEGALVYAPLIAWLRTDAIHKRHTRLDPLWLTEVARLVPDVLAERPTLSRSNPLVEQWQRPHFFEALARALVGNNQPLLLLLDDLQWCDQETLQWLHYLLRFAPHTPLLLLATLRAEELPSHPLLTDLLASLRRANTVMEITLGPLDATDTTSLARAIVGHDLTPTMAATLYQETEGNPLFVVETVRMGIPAQEASGQDATHTKSSPRMASATIRAVIDARLAQLSPAARELVNVAAVIGRAFTFDVLAQASGRDDDALVQALDELWQRRIVREQRDDVYDFSHDILREGAYSTLSTARKRLLHRRVAQALEAVHTGDLDAVSGQIAMHFEHARLFQQAVPYYKRAGEEARRVYAYADALASFRRALQLFGTLSVSSSQREERQKVTAELYEQVGDVLDVTGQYNAAIEAYQHALAQMPAKHTLTLASLHLKIGNICPMLNNYTAAQNAYEQGERVLDQKPPATAETSAWWYTWIDIRLGQLWVHRWPSDDQEKASWLTQTRQAVTRYGTPAQQATFFQSYYLMTIGEPHKEIAHAMLSSARTRLQNTQPMGNASEIAWARLDLGLASLWLGQLTFAEEQMDTALTVGMRTEDATLQARCLTFLAILYRKRGQVEATRRASLQVLAMQKAEYLSLAKANLAWIAWREDNPAEAEARAQTALAQWPPLLIVSPFQWTAHWPLLALSLARSQTAEAIEHARALLAPQQEALPDAVQSSIAAAVQAWDNGQHDTTHTHLQQACTQAQELGYL